MPKKVLFVITKSNWGGAQRYVFNLATSLPKSSFSASVALGGTGVSGSSVGELADRLQRAQVPTHYIAAFARDVALWSDIQAAIALYQLCKKVKPDVVHLNSSKAGGIGAVAARFARVPNIIFTSHGVVWDEDRSHFARTIIKIFSWCTFILCHKVIVISKDNVEQVAKLPFCKNKAQLIYNGLPQLQFESRERARVSIALKIGLTEGSDAFWIGTIAELTKNKGLTYLIEAAQILKNTGHKFHMYVIGEGEMRADLQNQIQQNNLHDCVHLVGFVSDAYRWNRAFDLFTLTSLKEGLPTVLLEAGQAGLPVVATNIPGCRDIIEDKNTGILVAPKNAQDLAQEIEKMIYNFELRKTLAQNLQQKVLQEFSINRMVEETTKLYS